MRSMHNVFYTSLALSLLLSLSLTGSELTVMSALHFISLVAIVITLAIVLLLDFQF